MKLDLRLTDGNFVTLDPSRPVARTLGVWRGRVVGFDDEVAGLFTAQETSLDGATVLPGFVDPHVHLIWAGLQERSASLRSPVATGSVAEVLAEVHRAALAVPVGDWVDIGGYDQRPLGRHLTVTELDSVAQGRKLFVIHDSGHACVVNSLVLDLLPTGTQHDDGFLAEAGMTAVRELRMPYAVRELVDAIETAGRTARSQGVTTVSEAGLGGGLVQHSPIELAAYQTALEAGRLPVRMQAMISAQALHPVRAHAHDAVAVALDLGLRTGLGSSRLAVGALKIWTDGGMMARTAAFTQPYAGSTGRGELNGPPEQLRKQIIEGHRAGWQVAVHAIGDAALDLALEGFERAHALHPRAGTRHRIEHAGLVRPDQLARFARLGLTPVVQPGFLWHFGDDYAAIMGPERAPWLYRGRSFLDHGIRVVASSDRPVTEGSPLRAVQFLVERLSSSGAAVGPGEALSVDAALRAHTLDAAWLLHREGDLGSLEPGKRADLVVLGDDPRRVDPSTIAGIEVLTTYLNGVRG